MTRSSDKKAAECHVLDFFYDDDNGCALTVFNNGVRVHIIADAARLKGQSKAASAIGREYRKLLSAVRDEAGEDGDPEKFKQRKELEVAEMHGPDNTASESQDSGIGQNEDNGESESEEGAGVEDTDHDSAVDVSEEKQSVKEIGVRDSGIVLGERYGPEAEKSLQNWMLSPFGDIFKDLAPVTKTPPRHTLEEWYHGPSHFFNLEIKGDRLSAKKEESSDDLQQRITDLIPRMPLPKYIKELDIPLVQAKDIIVLDEGAEPEPYHPVRVSVNDEVRFLKMVDMLQYQPTKREIKLLKEAENKGLHEKIRVPQVLGLVYEKSKSEIMGFLQTDIEDPTPLTKMLDSDVVEDNRQKWAKESQRIVDVLHEHNIVWGDAKADNFMVDKHGDLWIIDFGGSYTDGWVDPDLTETKEGDDMGTEKIVNALQDPEANTFEPEADKDAEQGSQEIRPSKKRSRSEDDSDSTPRKRRK